MTEPLLQMIRYELRHLEHRHLALAAEHSAELVVGVDQPSVHGILQAVLLDVVPDLLRDFGARQRLCADHGAERRRRRHRLHESGIRFTLGAGFFGR